MLFAFAMFRRVDNRYWRRAVGGLGIENEALKDKIAELRRDLDGAARTSAPAVSGVVDSGTACAVIARKLPSDVLDSTVVAIAPAAKAPDVIDSDAMRKAILKDQISVLEGEIWRLRENNRVLAKNYQLLRDDNVVLAREVRRLQPDDLVVSIAG